MFECITVILCLIINAFLAGTEAAFLSLNKPVLRELVKQGKKDAILLLQMRENPERTLSVIQIGITFVGAFAAAVGGAGAEETISPLIQNFFHISDGLAEVLAIMVIVVPLTYLSVVIGELVPKTLALKMPLSFSIKAVPWLFFISRFINPIVTLLEYSTKIIVSKFIKHAEIDLELQHDDAENVLKKVSILNREYVLNIVKIERTRVKEICIEWKNVIHINCIQTIAEVEAIILSSGHTRLPVLDHNNIIGVLNTKEFLVYQRTGHTNWVTLVRPIVQVHEDMPILSALRVMQKKRSHIGIVFNQYHHNLGIITIEDVIEEIIGDIYDEDDDGSIKHMIKSSMLKK